MALLKDVWDRFVLYLPLMMMVTLALGTYWLVHSTPTTGTPATEQPLTHDPDYFMEDFSIRTFDATGRIRTEVQGAKARHFPDTQWLEIDGIHIKSHDLNGRVMTATANQGLTNEDTSEIQLLGNAVVVRDGADPASARTSPRMEYRGEFLHAFLTTERLVSHKPVELIRGKDRFTADSLSFDSVDQTLELRGRVRGTLVP